MDFRRFKRPLRAGVSFLALFALLPPVGFGFCATPDGHFEVGFFDSVSVECCASPLPAPGDDCETPQCASCDDAAMTLQSALPIDHVGLEAPDRSHPLPLFFSTDPTSTQRDVASQFAGPDRDGTAPSRAPALETTLLRP